MLLLLFNPSGQGTISWAGLDAARTAYVLAEDRVAIA